MAPLPSVVAKGSSGRGGVLIDGERGRGGGGKVMIREERKGVVSG